MEENAVEADPEDAVPDVPPPVAETPPESPPPVEEPITEPPPPW